MAREKLLEEQKYKSMQAENARAMTQADYDLLKEGFKDPVTSKLQYLDLIGSVYGNMSWSAFNINHMSEEDPVAQIVQKFTKMAKIEV